VITEFGGNEINQVKADPDKDDENRRTLNSSLLAASPHWMINMLTCSMVVVSSCPENLVKSGTLYQFGCGSHMQEDMVSDKSKY